METSPRIGMQLPDDLDPQDAEVLANAFKLLEKYVGFQEATSSTRPASPFPGQAIFETDTENALLWNSDRGKWAFPLKSVETGLVPSGNTAARDAYFPDPGALVDQQIAFQNKTPRWFNNEPGKMWTEQYFASYDATKNPRGVPYSGAGWYPTSGMMPHLTLFRGQSQLITNDTVVSHGFDGNNTRNSWGGVGNNATDWFKWDTATGQLLIRRTGRYRLRASIQWQVGTGTVTAAISRNTVGFLSSALYAVDQTSLNSGIRIRTSPFRMDGPVIANDIIRVMCNTSSAQISDGGSIADTLFEVEYLGPLLGPGPTANNVVFVP